MQIKINDDFDMKKIADSGQAFRIAQIDAVANCYRFITQDQVIYIKQLGDAVYDISCNLDTWEKIWVPYFDLERNYQNIRHSIPSKDIFHKEASEFGKGIRILKQDPFEMLLTFIISQRKNIPAIKASVEKICTLYGHRLETPYEVIYTFPTSDDIINATENELSTCSLGYRLPYILDAIRKTNYGDIDLESLRALPTAELFDALLSVKGVGKKVANCICLFAYNRLECAPIDVWIEKVINLHFNGINPYPEYGNIAGIMQQYAFYYIR